MVNKRELLLDVIDFLEEMDSDHAGKVVGTLEETTKDNILEGLQEMYAELEDG